MFPVQSPNQTAVSLPQVFQVALLNNVSEAIISTDKQFTVLTWNRAAELIYGISAQDAIGKSTRDLFNYEYIDTDREAAKVELKANHFWKGVVKFKRHNNVTVTLEASITEIMSDSGELLGYVAVNRDISENTGLRVCLDTLKSTFSVLGESICVINRHFIVKYCNTKASKDFFETYGRALQTEVSIIDQLSGDHQEAIQERLTNAFNGLPDVGEFTVASKTDESFISLVAKFCPIKDSTNEVQHVCVIIKNHTKQKMADDLRKSLQSSKEVFEEFMNSSELVAWIADRQGNMQYMNNTYLRAFRLNTSYHGKHMYELFPKAVAEKYISNNELVMSKGEPINTIEKAILPNGSVRTYKVCKFPLYVHNMILIAGWAVDLSDELISFRSVTDKT